MQRWCQAVGRLVATSWGESGLGEFGVKMEYQGVLWSMIFDQLSDGICIAAPSGPLLYMNPAAEHQLGISKNALNEKSLCDVLCAHLSMATKADCASKCPLRDPA